MDPATLALIVKGVTLGADLLNNGVKAYNANKAAFSSEDQAVIEAAIASVSTDNDAKAQAALKALEAAAKT